MWNALAISTIYDGVAQAARDWLRDYLQQRLQTWRARVIAEFQALGDPPLSPDEARAAFFQMRSYVLGVSEARRMMGDVDARRSAQVAFTTLLDRTARAAA